MGWGLSVDNVYLPRVSKNTIEEQIEEMLELRKQCSERLLILAASSPRDIRDENGNFIEWERHIQTEVNAAVSSIEEAAGKLLVLYVAREDPDSASDI